LIQSDRNDDVSGAAMSNAHSRSSDESASVRAQPSSGESDRISLEYMPYLGDIRPISYPGAETLKALKTQFHENRIIRMCQPRHHRQRTAPAGS